VLKEPLLHHIGGVLWQNTTLGFGVALEKVVVISCVGRK